MMKRMKYIHIVLAVLLAAMLAATAAILWRLRTPVQGTFVPPEFDAGAVSGSPEVTDQAMLYTELDVAGNYRVSLCGSPVMEQGRLHLLFTSPADNSVWLKLRIMDQDGQVLGESGLVRPGAYLPYVLLEQIPGQGENLTVKVISYQPDTYLSMGSANIKVTVRIQA